MTDAGEARVIEFIAAVAGIKPQRISPTMRLLHDLGIDGDDAVALFDGLHRRFGTDLAHLYERWSEHFGPEGIPLSAGLIVIAVAVVGGIVAAAANSAAGSMVAIVAGVSTAATAFWITRKLGRKRARQIAVADVVRAVEAGSWPQ